MTGKYAYYREIYLQEKKPKYYAELVESGELNEHLEKINQQAHDMKDRIVERLKKDSEEWKRMEEDEHLDFMKKWQLLTEFGNIADEYIYQDIIYA